MSESSSGSELGQLLREEKEKSHKLAVALQEARDALVWEWQYVGSGRAQKAAHKIDEVLKELL